MANVQDTLKELLISTLEGAGESSNGSKEQKTPGESSESGKKGGHGLAAGAAGLGAAALAPMAFKGLTKLAREAGMDGVQELVKSPGKAAQGLGSNVGSSALSSVGDKVKDKVEDAGGPAGILSDAVKGAVGGGGGGDSKGGGLGTGKGRRMPVQQSIDIAAPLETVYNQWTQFEEWPNFMHRVVRASQDDDSTVKIAAKIWTRTREFTATIETQRPDERIKWKVSDGITHAGVVSFHELGPNLTRVLLSIDVQPGGMIEKMARGMRHVKRAARGDLHRFKAFIEMAGHESGAWRGVIEDGEVVEEHDPSYDEGREYSDVKEVLQSSEESSDDDEDEAKDDQDDDSAEATSDDADSDDEPKAKRPRRRRQQSSNGHGGDDSAKRPQRARASSRSSSSRAASSGGSSSGRSKARSSSSPRSSGNDSGSGRSRRSSGGSSSGRRSRARSKND